MSLGSTDTIKHESQTGIYITEHLKSLISSSVYRNEMQHKSVIFVVILVLAVTLIYSSSTTFSALGAGKIRCDRTATMTVTCCQDHVINRSPANPAGTLVRYCADCTVGKGGVEDVTNPEGHLRNCSERYIDMSAEQLPTPSLPTSPNGR